MKTQTKEEQLDVDVRFLLANERTLLAWIRTSIAIEAGGLALTALHTSHKVLGAAILLLGAAVAMIGYHRYVLADRAIRQGALPPRGYGSIMQLFGVVSLVVLLAFAQLTVLR